MPTSSRIAVLRDIITIPSADEAVTKSSVIIERPLCPKCGRDKPASNGPQWICRECGKQWVKHNHPRHATEFNLRPPCPECGSNRIISNGPQWICGDCRKQWVKITRARKGPDFSGRPPCPECGNNRTLSKGRGWVCDRCGRTWLKQLRRV